MLLELASVSKVFKTRKSTITALDNVSIKIDSNRFMALSGPSGSGKTTLLNIIGGLDKPTSGQIIFKEKPLYNYTANERADFRFKEIGFVFQGYNLMPNLNIKENLMLGLLVGNRKLHIQKEEAKRRCEEIIEYLNLGKWVFHLPAQLSGGQKQRVAIGRALVKRPSLILADEPTANLDEENSMIILNYLKDLNKKFNTAIILSTHDSYILNSTQDIVKIIEGKIYEKGSS